MSLVQKAIVKVANSRFGVPLKEMVRKVRESYYNAEVLRRPVTKTAPLKVTVHNDAPRRVNLLIPEINFARFYGGYIAKFHLARKLVEAGYQVRVITVDQCNEDLVTWRREIEAYDGLENIFEKIEVACCYDRSRKLIVSPRDRVIATTWWTAYIADRLIQSLDCDRFIYLIQEYEPYTFPMGSYFALAHNSYDLPHYALYSTELLQELFVSSKFGFNHQEGTSDNQTFEYFENAIISYVENPPPVEPRSSVRKLLFYARPEAHAARNMFEVGYLALCRAIDAGVFDNESWEFHGIGSAHGDIPLSGGRVLKMLGKFGLLEYKQRLLEYDLGLALMYTPHPSLLPLEMASAGMLVVTNTCQNKTREKMSQISANLRAAEPTIEGVVAELASARSDVDDMTRRRTGAAVNWASNWGQALDTRRMSLIRNWLESDTSSGSA
ncbi:MAG: hypothetical protein DHS20C01_15660 [marine bacterium B5-7]|nr:MAG: hypothetical protein DHS20C01_15660 [marine bacterium B5-7]